MERKKSKLTTKKPVRTRRTKVDKVEEVKEEKVEVVEEVITDVTEVKEEEEVEVVEVEKEIEVTEKVEEVIEEKVVLDEVKEEPEPRPRLEYRTLYGGFRLFKKDFKKNESFKAYPEEIPTAFMDKVVCISDEATIAKTVQDVDKPGTKEDLYTINKTRSPAWFDVVNIKTGKAINEKSLRIAAAQVLRDTLNA